MSTLPKTCKAAALVDFGKPLEIREVKVPETLEPGAILVKINVASVCGSDVHLWKGDLRGFRPIPLPVIPGHEMTGSIVQFGEGATVDSAGQPLNIGDRIVWSHTNCGKCYYCIKKLPNLCSKKKGYGRGNCEEFPFLTGGFAEYCYVYPDSGRLKVPDEVKDEWASAISCALRSVMHAMEVLGALENPDTLLIQGAGPVGLFFTAVASNTGVSKIIVMGAPRQRLEVAKAYGATNTISIEATPDPAQRLELARELTEGRGPDVVIEASGGPTAFKEGIDLIRPGGTYVVVGQSSMTQSLVPIQPTLITAKHLRVLGSLSADISHYYKGIQFVKNNRDKFNWDLMISNRYRLDDVNQAMTLMKEFKEIKPVIVP